MAARLRRAFVFPSRCETGRRATGPQPVSRAREPAGAGVRGLDARGFLRDRRGAQSGPAVSDRRVRGRSDRADAPAPAESRRPARLHPDGRRGVLAARERGRAAHEQRVVSLFVQPGVPAADAHRELSARAGVVCDRPGPRPVSDDSARSNSLSAAGSSSVADIASESGTVVRPARTRSMA